MKIKGLFQYISYLQYPFMLIALYFAFKPYFNGFENFEFESLLAGINNMLIFMGLSVSFSTLQDTTKTQNEVSRKVWEDPIKGKVFIGILTGATFIAILLGLAGYFSLQDSTLRELSFGFTTFGVGLIGMLKSAIEMFEHHRKDKNVTLAGQE